MLLEGLWRGKVWEPLDYYRLENVPRASVDVLLGTKWWSKILSDH